MEALSLLLFFVYTYSLGYAATTFFADWESSFYERQVMRIGIGLALLIFLLVVLDFFRVSLDWRIVLTLCVLPAAVQAYRNRTSFTVPSLGVDKDALLFVGIAALFGLVLFMFVTGAFSYPYLEDDDPWSHAMGIFYIAHEKTLHDGNQQFQYFDPYPPGYEGLMSILVQTAGSLQWTLKFFNALIASIGILFFGYFSYRLTNHRWKALIATGILAAVPSYLSHFIWSHSLVVTLMLVAFYMLVQGISSGWKWAILSSFVIASVPLTQPTQALKFLVMACLVWAAYALYSHRLMLFQLSAIMGGYLLSGIWWFFHLSPFRGPGAVADATAGTSVGGFSVFHMIASFFWYLNPESGTATRVYTFNDFFFAQPVSLMTNPVGIGIGIYLLLFAGLLFYLYRHYLSYAAGVPKKEGALKYAALLLLSLCAFSLLLLAARYLLLALRIPLLTSLYLDLFAFVAISVSCLFFCIVESIGSKGENKSRIPAYALASVLLLLFTFLGINSMTFNLPMGLFAFRFWMLFALPLSILAAEGAWFAASAAQSLRIPKAATLAAIIVLVFFTSAVQKYEINTSMWPPGVMWTSGEELAGYVWMYQSIPLHSRVFDLSSHNAVIGFDMYSCEWCAPVREMRRNLFGVDAGSLHSFLKDQGYEYMVVGGMSVRQLSEVHGVNETAAFLNSVISTMAGSSMITPVHQTQGMTLFSINE
ncbi:TPA: hypothetical protein HA361_01790 [Candidatus Woesearchaeota archaeon]|nr:hypothetical protein [Candidatus Woesearchaeota archaeon]